MLLFFSGIKTAQFQGKWEILLKISALVVAETKHIAIGLYKIRTVSDSQSITQ